MRIEFRYYTQKGQWEPNGFMAIDLDKILLSEKGYETTRPFPIGNVKKIFKVLHELAPQEVRDAREQSIAWWLKCKFEEMKAKEHQPSEQLVDHMNHWKAVMDGKEETQMSKKAVKQCYEQARKRVDDVRFSKKDAKIMKRLEGIRNAFLDSCKWEGEIA